MKAQILWNKDKIRTHFDIKCSICDPSLRIMKNKTIVNKWDLINIENCTAKEITSEGKKTTLRMENSCKQRYPQGVYIQHIQTACTVQYQKPNNPIKKINQRSKCTFLQRRHRDGYKAHKKMLSLTSS